jgi:hypothetical protein
LRLFFEKRSDHGRQLGKREWEPAASELTTGIEDRLKKEIQLKEEIQSLNPQVAKTGMGGPLFKASDGG